MRSSLPALALVALVVVAGCLGGSSAPAATADPTTDRGANDAGTTPDASTTTVDGTTELTCSLDRDRLRAVAVDHVADETGAAPANVEVLEDAVASYEVLGECYYHAKVRGGDDVRGVFVAANGTVVERDVVERRADRAYRERYGKLGVDLYEHLGSVATGERVTIRVAVTDVDRDAARAAVNDSLNATAYRRALEAEVERRVDRKTAGVASQLRDVDGVTVEREGSLVVVATATPAAIEQVERVDAVERITLRRTGTTTRVPRGGDE